MTNLVMHWWTMNHFHSTKTRGGEIPLGGNSIITSHRPFILILHPLHLYYNSPDPCGVTIISNIFILFIAGRKRCDDKEEVCAFLSTVKS